MTYGFTLANLHYVLSPRNTRQPLARWHCSCACGGSAFAQRPTADSQGLDDDDIRHRETSAELRARTTQELEGFRTENAKLRKREHDHVSTKVRKRQGKREDYTYMLRCGDRGWLPENEGIWGRV